MSDLHYDTYISRNEELIRSIENTKCWYSHMQAMAHWDWRKASSNLRLRMMILNMRYDQIIAVKIGYMNARTAQRRLTSIESPVIDAIVLARSFGVCFYDAFTSTSELTYEQVFSDIKKAPAMLDEIFPCKKEGAV